MPTYNYTVQGTAAGGQTWTTQGEVLAGPGDFPNAVNEAMRRSFDQLTQGKATYGQPGQGGCRGPYGITKLVVELQP